MNRLTQHDQSNPLQSCNRRHRRAKASHENSWQKKLTRRPSRRRSSLIA
jgi:hypothetical protein